MLTDIRPVFGEDVGTRPSGAVIVQILQIQTWSRESGVGSLYIAMDEVDLRELRDVIDRALRKTDTLRDTLDAQGITHFQLDPREA